MSGIFTTPHHVTLLNSCYPPAKALSTTSNPQPDSNNLSRLCFYASVPPHSSHKRQPKASGQIQSKLPKVVKALIRRVDKDAAAGPKGRGGLLVSLSVLAKLIEECATVKETAAGQHNNSHGQARGHHGTGADHGEANSRAKANMDVLAADAIKIIDVGLGRSQTPVNGKRDVELAARALSAFAALVTYLPPSVLKSSSDETVLKPYLSVLARVCGLAKDDTGSAQDSAASRYVGLQALVKIVNAEPLWATDFDRQVGYILPALIINIIDEKVEWDQLKEAAAQTDSEAGLSDLQLRQPLAKRRFEPVSAPTDDDKSALTTTSLALSALAGLRTLYRIAHTTQIESCLSSTLTFLDSFKSGSLYKRLDLCSWLAESAARWSHVQYRFAVMTFLVHQFNEGGDTVSGGQSGPIRKYEALLAMIKSVLTSDVNLVGLGVGDAQHQLTDILCKRVAIFGGSEREEDLLIPGLVDAVGSLGRHIYYADQIGDMVTELLAKALALQGSAPGKSHRRSRQTAVVLEAITKVFEQARAGGGEIKKAVPASKDAPNEPKQNGVANGVKSPKSPTRERDALGRPVLAISLAGPRTAVPSEPWRDSLSLLLDPAAPVRVAYAHALLGWIESDMDDTDLALEGLLEGLHAGAYELTTSKSLSSAAQSGTGLFAYGGGANGADGYETDGDAIPDRRGSISAASVRSTKRANGRSAAGGESAGADDDMAGPIDFAALKALLGRIQERKSVKAVVVGVPMLLALDRDAGNVWSQKGQEGETAQEEERRTACRELVSSTLLRLGNKWGIKAVSDAAENNTSPSIVPKLPRLGTLSKRSFSRRFSASASSSPKTNGIADYIPGLGSSADPSSPVIDRTTIIEALSSSADIQAASGLDKSALRGVLGGEWSAVEAIQKSFGQEQIISNRGRGTGATSPTIVRTNSIAASHRSMQSTSIADLRASLGNGTSTSNSAYSRPVSRAGSVAAKSFRSIGGDGSPPVGNGVERRKSVRMQPTDVLKGLTTRQGSIKKVEEHGTNGTINGYAIEGSQAEQPSKASKRLSIFNAPYSS